MIRIVDILKAGGDNPVQKKEEPEASHPPPKEETPAPPPVDQESKINISSFINKVVRGKFSSDDIKQIYGEICALTKKIVQSENLNEEEIGYGRKILSAFERMIDRHMVESKEAIKVLDKLTEEKDLIQALNLTIICLRLAIDAGTAKERLIELAAASFSHALKQEQVKDVMCGLADIENSEYKNIIGLAEIYGASRA